MNKTPFLKASLQVCAARRSWLTACLKLSRLGLLMVSAMGAHASQITYKPYIQPGDSPRLEETDQIVVTWQTDEKEPSPGAYSVYYGEHHSLEHRVTPTARVVDNYLAVDSTLAALSIPTAYPAHTNYYAVLTGLEYDDEYSYKVTGPGLPTSGFVASFVTRTRGSRFSFQVMGDEGYYPGIPKSAPNDSALVANFEARIIHTMYNVANLSFVNQPRLPTPDFALNTGDNVYVTGGDTNYRDTWMSDWNSDTDSNERGAPFIRHIPLYIVAGNHDIGGTGATANLLADTGPTTPGFSGPGPFGGGLAGGDALAYFNNYYFPLNGPQNVDIQYRFNGASQIPSNFLFQYNGISYSSPAAIESLRASTKVNTGGGNKRQIDHMSNYSFDFGNTHFVFLDANPHLFNNLLPGGATYENPPAFPFPPYPSILREWLIKDLDGSKQDWKIVVYHQPAFSSGNATLSNDQMRNIAKLLEDHGVNLVFNGHEHNYQRSVPLRALAGVTQSPTFPGPAAVAADTQFDGHTHVVPDGVMYIVEGAGGNRDFDDALANPRGGGVAVADQEDSASGTFSPSPGLVFPNGPASWLDSNLTNAEMAPFLPGAGSGPKITARFKAKVFSFADITVRGNALTLYQITEPLSDSSSATAIHPFPFGTDLNGHRLNDPIPDTVIDPATRQVVSSIATGVPALLDKITILKPHLDEVQVKLVAPDRISAGSNFDYTVTITSDEKFALNGAQVVVTLPPGFRHIKTIGGEQSQIRQEVIVSVGRIPPGSTKTVTLTVKAPPAAEKTRFVATALLRSSTALPVSAEEISTRVVSDERDRD